MRFANRFKLHKCLTTARWIYGNASHNMFWCFHSVRICLQRKANKFAWLICRVKSLICKMFSFFSHFGWEKRVSASTKNSATELYENEFKKTLKRSFNTTYDDGCLRKLYEVSACAVHHLVLYVSIHIEDIAFSSFSLASPENETRISLFFIHSTNISFPSF